jgi:hypothetical protein
MPSDGKLKLPPIGARVRWLGPTPEEQFTGTVTRLHLVRGAYTWLHMRIDEAIMPGGKMVIRPLQEFEVLEDK